MDAPTTNLPNAHYSVSFAGDTDGMDLNDTSKSIVTYLKAQPLTHGIACSGRIHACTPSEFTPEMIEAGGGYLSAVDACSSLAGFAAQAEGIAAEVFLAIVRISSRKEGPISDQLV
jgi:hypothetical protein